MSSDHKDHALLKEVKYYFDLENKGKEITQNSF